MNAPSTSGATGACYPCAATCDFSSCFTIWSCGRQPTDSPGSDRLSEGHELTSFLSSLKRSVEFEQMCG
jgi:hypothetical protein